MRHRCVVCQREHSWWRHQEEPYSALLALCAGNSPVPVNSPHKGQWRGALMFSLICAWIDDWINNREACDLRRHRGHYDVNVMGIMADEWIESFQKLFLIILKTDQSQMDIYSQQYLKIKVNGASKTHRTSTLSSVRSYGIQLKSVSYDLEIPISNAKMKMNF